MAWIALALAATLVGCRANLFAPDAAGHRSTPGGVSLVQPYLLVLGPDGASVSRASIYIDPSFYQSGASGVSYQHKGPISQIPEAVEAPFSIEVRLSSPQREHLVLDVFPAAAETLVLQWPPPNFGVRLEWPASIADEEVQISSVDLSVRIDNRSEHLPASELRTRWWSTRTEFSESRILLASLPATADSVRSVNPRWRVAATDSTPTLYFEADAPGVSFPGTDEVTVAATFEPMPLRAVWGGGAFELEQFDLTTTITRPDGSSETVRVRPRRGMWASREWGWPGEMEVTLLPFDQYAVFPWRDFVVWNGVDEVVLELGRHEFTTRVVDSEGEPYRFAALRLTPLAPGLDTLRQTSGPDGRVVWYVNDGDYQLEFEGDSFSTAPRGGPWRVHGDLSVTWEIP